MKFNYKKEALKSLKGIVKFYDALRSNVDSYSRSDDIIADLESTIFSIGCSVCPTDCYSLSDILEYVRRAS